MTAPEKSNGHSESNSQMQPTIETPETAASQDQSAAVQGKEQAQAPEQKPAPKPTRILLIRHGVNDYVKKGLLAGRTPEVHLNDEGRAQAQAVAERLGGEKIAAVYSSPLERCQETAAALAERLGLELHTLEDVKETDCGDWTGQSLEELRKLESWTQVQVNPSGFRFPNGESMFEIQTRMVAGLDRLQREHAGETIAVFSHSDPIKLAIGFFVGSPLDLFQRLEISPASISELDFSPLRVRLIRMNDCAHVPAPVETPQEAEGTVATEAATGESPTAQGALEEQAARAPDRSHPNGAGPEPEAVQVADEGKIQATGG